MSKKLNIQFIIFANKNSSGGGHFYSLSAIEKMVRKFADTNIIQLGYSSIKVISSKENSYFIRLFNFTFFLKIFKLISLTKQNKPDVLHAFDHRSLFIAKVINFFYKVPVVYTKCGGSNDGNLIPFANHYILFSQENYTHFLHNKINPIRIHLIPNRSNKIKIDEIKINQLKSDLKLADKKVILRISRFNEYYKLTFQQAINFLKKNLEIDINSVLVFVGYIGSQTFFDYLVKECKGLPVYFVTTSNYTTNASKLLEIADVVIATGRGVMEAASLNKIIFCPIQKSNLPLLLTNDTYEILAKTNFSERCFVNDKLVTEINSLYFSNHYINSSEEIFQKHFSVDSVQILYEEIYNNVLNKKCRLKMKDLIKQAYVFFKPKLRH